MDIGEVRVIDIYPNEWRSLVAAIAPENRFIDTKTTTGNLVICAPDTFEPVIQFRRMTTKEVLGE